MSSPNNEIAERLETAFAANDVPTLDEVLDPDLVDHHAPPDQKAGLAGWKDNRAKAEGTFTDLQVQRSPCHRRGRPGRHPLDVERHLRSGVHGHSGHRSQGGCQRHERLPRRRWPDHRNVDPSQDGYCRTLRGLPAIGRCDRAVHGQIV